MCRGMVVHSRPQVTEMPMQRVTQSPVDPAFVQDPFAFYRAIRSLDHFVYWEDYAMPVATTRESVNLVLKHPKLGRAVPDALRQAPRAELKPFYDIEDHSMLELEPPVHTRLRQLVLRGFASNRVHLIAPDISQLCDLLIDGFPKQPFDLLDAYARPLPVRVIARLLGVPEDKAPDLLRWSNDMVAMYQARRNAEIELAAATAAQQFSDFVRAYVDERRQTPDDDLISQLIAAEMDGEKLSSDELVSTCILLLNAGHEATVHTIGNAVRHLTGFGERALALEPENIAATVEECLRFDPPLHMFTRHVYEPVTILGQYFKPGDKIGCLLGSACHDDAVWPDGDRFDPFRQQLPHLAFGAGIQFCVGAPLARLEMQIALPALFSRCPGIQIVEPPKVANLYHFRGLERLMVECNCR